MNDMITIVKSVILKNYVNFEGRANRPEFWWFYLFNFIVGLVLSLLALLISRLATVFTVISYLYSLAVLIPSLAVGARRLHDIGKSGWWQLIAFIPIVGAIILIIWWAKEGDPNENQYGPVPTTPTE